MFDSFAYDKKHPTIKKNYNADKNPTVYPLIGVYKDKGSEPWEGYMTEEEMKIK